MGTFLRLLGLILILNVIRYLVAGPIEAFTVLPGLFGAMAASPTVFNTTFTTFDWITSYFYNFMMWAICVWVFHLMHPELRGSWLIKSFKVFGLIYLLFASVSAVYMNHYVHPKTFYLYNILDGLIAFAVVALGNALLYPRLLKQPPEAQATEANA